MSSKTKVEHTPGWRVKVRPHGRKAIEDAHGNVMANVLGYDVEANARLFAAAPDLLAACEACEENLRLIHEAAGPVPKSAPMPRHSTFGAWEMARAAIAKARGVTEPKP